MKGMQIVWASVFFTLVFGGFCWAAERGSGERDRSGGTIHAATNSAAAVPLFAAIESGDVVVTVIPHREERVTLQVENKTDRPISLEMPPALAAAPVLAQFAPPFGGPNNQNQNANAPQAVGFPGPNNAQNNGANNNAGFPFPMNPGLFNVPAGKVIKVKLPAVCLEFGKRTPNSRIPYELRPIEASTDRPEVVTALAMIGRKEVRRRIGQLAIWHIANGTTWNELGSLQAERIGGLDIPQYSASEIQQARELVKSLDESAESTSRATASSRSSRRD